MALAGFRKERVNECIDNRKAMAWRTTMLSVWWNYA
jgi:hypothetical protein